MFIKQAMYNNVALNSWMPGRSSSLASIALQMQWLRAMHTCSASGCGELQSNITLQTVHDIV